MPVPIVDPERSTWIVIAALGAALLLSLRRVDHSAPMPTPVTQQLKGLAILAILFAHVSFMLVADFHFLYPLALGAGVGVDLFLFLSGYGLTVSMLKRPMGAASFYRRRLVRVFIPFWIALAVLFLADELLLKRSYPLGYVVQSFLGVFPSAIPTDDVNSPFWYLSWLLMFYLLYPLLFSATRPWLTALFLALIANAVAVYDPLNWQANWLHRLHTNAFSMGIMLAWLLSESRAHVRTLAASPVFRGAVILVLAVGAGYFASHNEEWQWPRSSQWLESVGFNAHYFLGQATSLVAMTAVVGCFALATAEFRLLALFGTYSYEIYLLHWALMARYDVFFTRLPEWAAMLCWLVTLVGAGWLLQKASAPLAALFDRQ